MVIAKEFIPHKSVHCFDHGCVGKLPVAGKEYCTERRSKELQKSMDIYNGCYNVNEVMLKTAYTPHKQSMTSGIG